MLKGKTTDVGEILIADRPRRLAYTFHHILNEAALKERPSRVSFTLEPHGKLVKLTLTHVGFAAGGKMLPAISKGWPAILSSLKSMLETGQPLDISTSQECPARVMLSGRPPVEGECKDVTVILRAVCR